VDAAFGDGRFMDRNIGCKLFWGKLRGRDGFTLIEVVASLAILALMSSATLMVVKRAMAATADSSLKMQALEITRENMEQLLSGRTVKEGTDFGESERYPNITWQTTVESFSEPVAQRMWVKVICGAEYIDSNDVTRQIELTHWITSVTKDTPPADDAPPTDDPPPKEDRPKPKYPWGDGEPTMDELMAYIRSVIGGG